MDLERTIDYDWAVKEVFERYLYLSRDGTDNYSVVIKVREPFNIIVPSLKLVDGMLYSSDNMRCCLDLFTTLRNAETGEEIIAPRFENDTLEMSQEVQWELFKWLLFD